MFLRVQIALSKKNGFVACRERLVQHTETENFFVTIFVIIFGYPEINRARAFWEYLWKTMRKLQMKQMRILIATLA
jgi:hypothetical protein